MEEFKQLRLTPEQEARVRKEKEIESQKQQSILDRLRNQLSKNSDGSPKREEGPVQVVPEKTASTDLNDVLVERMKRSESRGQTKSYAARVAEAMEKNEDRGLI